MGKEKTWIAHGILFCCWSILSYLFAFLFSVTVIQYKYKDLNRKTKGEGYLLYMFKIGRQSSKLSYFPNGSGIKTTHMSPIPLDKGSNIKGINILCNFVSNGLKIKG